MNPRLRIHHFFRNILNIDSYLFYYFYEKVREKGGREKGGEGEGERERERERREREGRERDRKR